VNAKAHGKTSEPLFYYPAESSAQAIAAAHAKARELLPQFAAALRERKCGVDYNVKVYFPEAEGQPHIWLAVNDLLEEMYFCSAREIPKDFHQLKRGQSLVVTEDRIEDWMILADGILYGGFSLRTIRELLPVEERAGFDEHVGVVEYRDGTP
jgi:uncharacterized protein YegJ (DUF2314 family)